MRTLIVMLLDDEQLAETLRSACRGSESNHCVEVHLLAEHEDQLDELLRKGDVKGIGQHLGRGSYSAPEST